MNAPYRLVPVEPTEEMQAILDQGCMDIWADVLAVAPQPAALGGEPEVLGWRMDESSGKFAGLYRDEPVWHYLGDPEEYRVVPLIDRAHLAPLQVEIHRLRNMDHRQVLAEAAAKHLLDSGAENFVGEVFSIAADDGVTKFEIVVTTQRVGGKSPGDVCNELKARNAELEELLRKVVALDPRGEFMGWQLDTKIDAALSKPAEGEPV